MLVFLSSHKVTNLRFRVYRQKTTSSGSQRNATFR
jgi:hypothetical protein